MQFGYEVTSENEETRFRKFTTLKMLQKGQQE